MENKEKMSEEVAEIIVRGAIMDGAIEAALGKARVDIFKVVLVAFLKAFAWIGGGIFATWLGIEGAKEAAEINGSASYVVWWGAVVYGIIKLVQAFIVLLRSFVIYKDFKKELKTQREIELSKFIVEKSKTDSEYETHDK